MSRISSTITVFVAAISFGSASTQATERHIDVRDPKIAVHQRACPPTEAELKIFLESQPQRGHILGATNGVHWQIRDIHVDFANVTGINRIFYKTSQSTYNVQTGKQISFYYITMNDWNPMECNDPGRLMLERLLDGV